MTHTDWNSISNVLETAYKMNEKQQSLIVKVNQTSIRNLSEVLQALKNFSGVLNLRIEGMPFTPDIIFDGVSSLMNLDILFNRVLFFKQNCRPIKMTIRDCPNLQSVVLDSIEYDEFFYSAPFNLSIINAPKLENVCCNRQGIIFKKFDGCENLSYIQGECVKKIERLPHNLRFLSVENNTSKYMEQLNSEKVFIKENLVPFIRKLDYAGPGPFFYRQKDCIEQIHVNPKKLNNDLLLNAPKSILSHLSNTNSLGISKISLLQAAFFSAKKSASKKKDI